MARIKRLATALAAIFTLIAAYFLSDSYVTLPFFGERPFSSTSRDLGLTDEDISNVLDRAESLAKWSWELSTAAEAAFELYNPEVSVFSPHVFPDGQVPSLDIEQIRGLQFIKPWIWTGKPELQDGRGGSGDPPSLGIASVLIGQSEPKYRKAVERQLDFLLHSVPRWENGALSHRVDYAELWGDFVYMVPPFLAYMAVAHNNTTLMRQSIGQIDGYAEVLRANTTRLECPPLWKHIVGPVNADPGFWSTSNGWAAMGIARVIATIKHWDHADQTFASDRVRLVDYVKEMLHGVICIDAGNDGLLRNYIDDESWFPEAAGTAALAAAAYRMRVLEPRAFKRKYITWADQKYAAILKHMDKRTGVVSPVVYPLNHLDRQPLLSGSSEGQSFVALMVAAKRDCAELRLC